MSGPLESKTWLRFIGDWPVWRNCGGPPPAPPPPPPPPPPCRWLRPRIRFMFISVASAVLQVGRPGYPRKSGGARQWRSMSSKSIAAGVMPTDRPLHEPRYLGGWPCPSAHEGLPQASLPAPDRQTVFSEDAPLGRDQGRRTRQRDGEDRPIGPVPGGDRAAHAAHQP